jgi:predicted nucleic acid-binding protein
VSVVVDTSVWVEFFRGDGDLELQALLDEGLVLLAPVVAAELLSAPLSSRERRLLTDVLEPLALHPTPIAHWFAVGTLRAKLAKSGVAISTPDAHVTQCALEADASLWSRDRIFARISERSELRLFKPR